MTHQPPLTPISPIYHTQSPPTSAISLDDPFSPHQFDAAKCAVEDMLANSLAKFVAESTGNQDGRRCVFALIGGTVFTCLSLAPILMSIVGGQSRWMRFSAFPLFWLGMTFLLTGSCRVCIVLFLFGDVRQLRGYELTRPSFTPLPITRGGTSSPVGSSLLKTQVIQEEDEEGEFDDGRGENTILRRRNSFAPPLHPRSTFNSRLEKSSHLLRIWTHIRR